MIPQQKTILLDWIATQPPMTSRGLWDTLRDKAVTAWDDTPTVTPRDDVIVKGEKLMLAVGSDAGIAKTDGPTVIFNKLNARIAAVPSADTAKEVFRCSTALALYYIKQTMDVSGDETTSTPQHKPIAWAQSLIDTLGLPADLSTTEIEEVQRGQ